MPVRVAGTELLEIDPSKSENIRADPMRLIEAVTAGVAFLAAGSIISSGGAVRGLTTGASMWMAGAIGVACGIGELALAFFALAITMIVLLVLGWLKL